MPSRPPICVVVGSGYTGHRALQSLPADRVLGISRTPTEQLGRKIIALDLDAPQLQNLRLPDPCTLLYTVPPNSDSNEDRRLAAFLAHSKPAPRRIVYLGTSGVYGDRHGELTRETDPVNPSTARAKRRLAAEQLLTQWCGDAGSELLVLRVSGIYGPGRLGLERLRSGKPIIRESDCGAGNRVHVEDLVSCCIAALNHNTPPGIYNIADGDHRSNYWFRRKVADLAGLSAPAEISLQEAEKSWSEMRLSFLRESRQLDTEKLHSVLKVKLRYADAENGIRASLSDESDRC